ncbi:MAG: hypothetical protein U1E76_02670 [Planctomycetota bacterium]
MKLDIGETFRGERWFTNQVEGNTIRLPLLLCLSTLVAAVSALAQDFPHMPVNRDHRGVEYRSDALLVRFRVGTPDDTHR